MHELIRADRIDVTINFILKQEDLLMKISEITAQLTEVDAKLTEARDEIVAKIADLEELIADIEVPAEISDLIASIRAKAVTLADIVTDVPAEPTPEQPA